MLERQRQEIPNTVPVPEIKASLLSLEVQVIHAQDQALHMLVCFSSARTARSCAGVAAWRQSQVLVASIPTKEITPSWWNSETVKRRSKQQAQFTGDFWDVLRGWRAPHFCLRLRHISTLLMCDPSIFVPSPDDIEPPETGQLQPPLSVRWASSNLRTWPWSRNQLGYGYLKMRSLVLHHVPYWKILNLPF